jgi:alpha-tubulin suppressor-like RCC1 family protein
LGDGTVATGANPPCACSTTPVLVAGITNAVAVTVGNYTACALLSTGGVDCWGDDRSGDLGHATDPFTGPDACPVFGNGQLCGSDTPVAVLGISDALAVSAGQLSTVCARLATGAVTCWGANNYGDLGAGRTLPSGRCSRDALGTFCSAPVAVKNLG